MGVRKLMSKVVLFGSRGLMGLVGLVVVRGVYGLTDNRTEPKRV